MSRCRARRRRAQLALLACALWLLGVEALPAIHEGLHDQLAPHRHDHGAMTSASNPGSFSVSFEDTTHRHPDGSIHYVAPASRAAASAAPAASRASGKPARDGRSRASSSQDHAAGLAHHAAAIAAAAPPITTPLPVDRRPSWLWVAASVELVTRDPLAPSARGPPSAA